MIQIGIPSKPKLWILADENERSKVYRFEDREDADVWMEIRLDKGFGAFTHTRNNFKTPGKWHRFSEPVRNHAVAKRGLPVSDEENT